MKKVCHAAAFNAFLEMVDGHAVDEIAADVQLMVRRLELRPELTDAEKVQARIAGDVLLKLSYDLRKRIICAAPNTTIFTVI